MELIRAALNLAHDPSTLFRPMPDKNNRVFRRRGNDAHAGVSVAAAVGWHQGAGPICLFMAKARPRPVMFLVAINDGQAWHGLS